MGVYGTVSEIEGRVLTSSRRAENKRAVAQSGLLRDVSWGQHRMTLVCMYRLQSCSYIRLCCFLCFLKCHVHAVCSEQADQ